MPPHIASMLDAIGAAQPEQGQTARAAVEALDDVERLELEAWLAFRANAGRSPEAVGADYLAIMDEQQELTLEFMRAGHYRHSRFDQVADAVYHDADKMRSYMEALAVTTFLWSNHREMYRFFRRVFPDNHPGRYLEIGPGHGFFLRHALTKGAFEEVRAIDISATSVALAREVVATLAPERAHLATIEQTDFLDASELPEHAFDVLVMGEVLEHVEDPRTFLTRLRQLAAPGAWAFITTCANAPAIDHIFLFHDADEVRALLEETGWEVIDAVELGWHGRSLRQCTRLKMPINVAYALRPATP